MMEGSNAIYILQGARNESHIAYLQIFLFSLSDTFEGTVNQKTGKPLLVSVSPFSKSFFCLFMFGIGETGAAAMWVFWRIRIWMRLWRIGGTGIAGALWVTRLVCWAIFCFLVSFVCNYWICDVGFVRNSVLDVGFGDGKGFFVRSFLGWEPCGVFVWGYDQFFFICAFNSHRLIVSGTHI